MTPERWREIERLYYPALELDAVERAAFLNKACGGDEGLRREVESLLAYHGTANDFMALPAVAVDLARFSPIASAVRRTQETSVPGRLVGRVFGSYEVRALIAVGGMGEVYRAVDTRLNRIVAIKTLPGQLSDDPDRQERLRREASVVSSLNHPHICTLHDVGIQDGIHYLVMEHIDGETLQARLERGPLPLARALEYATQICDALDKAHRRGVIHRDLKPANVMLAKSGVKLLDFGLAKVERAPVPAPDAHTRTLTSEGTILGTFQYMAPEQVEGKDADARTDIFAFGALVYEMITAKKAFDGPTQANVIGAILKDEPPPVIEIVPDAPVSLDRALARCLAKDPDDRWQTANDLLFELRSIASPAAAGVRSSRVLSASQRPWWRRAGPVAAAFGAGALAATAALFVSGSPNAPLPVTRLALGTRSAAALYVTGNDSELAITPDGSRVVYVGDGGRRIFVRALDQLEPVAIATGSLLKNPFVSPDGQWVGYLEVFLGIKKVPISGGPAILVTADGELPRGAVWLADDTIVFTTANPSTGLRRVSAGGGSPQVLTTPDGAHNEHDHFWPEALPDGRGVLYTVLARTGGLGAAKTAVYDLETNTSRDLLAGGTNAVYLRSGHLAYVAGGTLWTVPFDVTRRTITGAAAPRMKLTAATGNGAGNFAVSVTGTLAYAHAPGNDPFGRTLSWIDRLGHLEPLDAPEHPYRHPRISHDGTHVVHATDRDPESNLWVLDMGRRALTRLRNEAARDEIPSWSLDDRWIFYSSNRSGSNLGRLWRQAADGTGEPELMVDTPATLATMSPDGAHLIFTRFTPSSRTDIMRMALDGSSRVSPLVITGFNEGAGEVSPDGRWLAYQSNVSGRREIYVAPYPNAMSRRWPVSTAGGGGGGPLWSRDSRELFYMAPDGALMGVQVKSTGSSWAATSPVRVLEPGYWSSDERIGRQYDISPDGKRFLVVTPSRATPDPPDLVVEQHWLERLKSSSSSK